MAKKARRLKGSGTLRLRGKRWHAEIRVDTALGRKVLRGSFTSKRAATEWLKVIAEREAPYESDPTDPLTPLVQRWLATDFESAEPNTKKHVEYMAGLLKPATDALTLANCTTPLRVNEAHQAIPNLTSYQRKRTFAILKQFFNWCVRVGELRYSPMAVLRAPKHDTRRGRPLNHQQCLDFIAALADHRLGSLMIVVLTTGIRPGEAFGLQWDDVDLERGTILIRLSLEEISGQPMRLKAPKTPGSIRTIQLPEVAKQALADHAAKGDRRGHVWKSTRGTPIRKSNFRIYVLKPLLDSAKIAGRTFYDLRHSGLSVMLLATGNVRRTASVAGHTNAARLLSTYAHLVDMKDDAFMDKVDAAFRANAADCVQNSVHSDETKMAEDAATDEQGRASDE